MPITELFLGFVVGSAFVYDMYYGKIPNWLIVSGGICLLPIMGVYRGPLEPIYFILRVVAFTTVLLAFYFIGALGAGDIKLMGLICGALGYGAGIRYVIMVVCVGGVIGFFKIIYGYACRIQNGADFKNSRTPIKFTIPITICYLVIMIPKGGGF